MFSGLLVVSQITQGQRAAIFDRALSILSSPPLSETPDVGGPRESLLSSWDP